MEQIPMWVFLMFVTVFVLVLLAQCIVLYVTLYHRKRPDKKPVDTQAIQRAVLKGQIVEQLYPLLPDVPFQPSEMRFMGQPVDYIVFSGIDEGEVTEIIFVEVKTGQSRLSSLQRSIAKCVSEKRIRWETVNHREVPRNAEQASA